MLLLDRLLWLLLFSVPTASSVFVESIHEPIYRIPEGDYYISYARESKYYGFQLAFYKQDDLWLRDDLKVIWRLYYPNFAEPYFVLQNMWLGIDGDGHPWYKFFAQLDQDHIELEIADPTRWVAHQAAEPNTFYIRSYDHKSKWMSPSMLGSKARIAVRNHKHKHEVFKFVMLK